MNVSVHPLILVTGAAGMVGRAFIAQLLAEPSLAHWRVRALCHQRALPPHPRVESVHGAIQDRPVVQQALQGVSHVLHLATSKETPEDVMDVAVKGLFWLLEGCRTSPSFSQFILIGGDAAIGHFHYPHPAPVTEAQPTELCRSVRVRMAPVKSAPVNVQPASTASVRSTPAKL